ncbi:MAG TPA: CdvA-like protein, partial [Candidatus Binatus sp.]|nr:CdvA-like protein [Candidatus Binatus sp.]
KVIGITANLRDEATAVGVQTANGEFAQYPGQRLWINGENLTLIPAWKVDSEEFRKEFDIVTRRLRALDELFSVGDIQQDIYEDLRKTHEDGINELKEKRRSILDTLAQRTTLLNGQLRELQTYLASNKMLHASGEFDDAGYHVASGEIDAGLVRTVAERKDIESITTYLVRLDPTTPINTINHNTSMTQQPQDGQQQTQSPAGSAGPSGQQREQTLVLHVKEK